MREIERRIDLHSHKDPLRSTLMLRSPLSHNVLDVMFGLSLSTLDYTTVSSCPDSSQISLSAFFLQHQPQIRNSQY